MVRTSNAETSPHGSGQKLLAVLQQFGREDTDLGVTELSQLTGMDKTSIFRALKTLELYRFVEQDSATRKYRLGFAVVELANAKLKQMPLALVARPYLARLSRETGETVQMSVMDHLRVHYIGVVESPQPIRVGMASGRMGRSIAPRRERYFWQMLRQPIRKRFYPGPSKNSPVARLSIPQG